MSKKWTCHKAFAALRLWDTFPPGEFRVQSRREATPEPPEVEGAYEEMRGFWQFPRVGKDPKKHQKRWFKHQEWYFYTRKQKTFFSPKNFFLQQKLFYTRNTCASEAEVSLQQTHFASSSANILHHRKSLTPHTFAGAQIPGNDLEVNCWII